MTIKKNYQGTFIPQTLSASAQHSKKTPTTTKGKGVNATSKLNAESKKILKKITGGGFQKIE